MQPPTASIDAKGDAWMKSPFKSRTNVEWKYNNIVHTKNAIVQPFSIDSADFPCRSPAIFSPPRLYGQNIFSADLFYFS